MNPSDGKTAAYENPLVLAPLTQWHDIAHDELGNGHQPSPANARQSAEHDELHKRVCQGRC